MIREADDRRLRGKEVDPISCARCRRVYTLFAWRSLPAVRTLTSDEVQRHVTEWRDEHVIEVRSCAACGHPMARMVRSVVDVPSAG